MITIAPSQMYSTAFTKGDLPAVASKPGPFFGRNPYLRAAGGCGKAADMKYQTMGIFTNMFMAALHRDTLILTGNRSLTTGATQLTIVALLTFFFAHLLGLAELMLDLTPI
jgi:hypothetical protein